MSRLIKHIRDTYFSIDPRTLGLFRIFFGIIIMADFLGRIPGIKTWYSNEGLLPNYTLLQHPMLDWNFSLFLAASTPGQAAIGFLICGIIFFCFLIGWRTRLFHVLSFICMLSLHGRNNYIENASDIVRHILCLWTFFLPLGQRYSVDSLLRSLPTGASIRTAAKHEPKPVVSLAVFALTIQLGIIYFFNAVQKNGIAWHHGTVIHYILFMDFQVTQFGLDVRNHFPLWISKMLTWGTLVIEGSAPFLILSPVFTRYTRRIAIVSLSCLHIGMTFFMNLGLFSQTMLVYFILLLSSEDILFLRNLAVRVCGVFRLDPSRFPIRIYGWLHRGVSIEAISAHPVTHRLRTYLSEAVVLFFIVVLGSDVLVTNNAIPKKLRLKQPLLFEAIVGYAKLHQAWRLFAPDPPASGGNIIVDATTVDGRHVDPYNAEASDDITPTILKPQGYRCKDRFWNYYAFWIHNDPDSSVYLPALRDWILRYKNRTGNPNDEILAFEAFWDETISPAPGENKPTRLRRAKLVVYP